MIGWLTAEAAQVPPDDGWLCGGEPAVLAALPIPARRADWRAGRWAAKQAVAAALGVTAATVEVRADDGGVPHALRHGQALPVSISISHRAGIAVCAVASPMRPLGCDLELVEPRPAVFVSDWFTRAEKALVDGAPDDAERSLLVTAVWSAKESALKALGCGLRRDTRSVEAGLSAEGEDHGWHRLEVRDLEGDTLLPGWWRRRTELVLTLVTAAPADGVPVLLAEHGTS